MVITTPCKNFNSTFNMSDISSVFFTWFSIVFLTLFWFRTLLFQAIHQVNGHTYKVGSTKDLMYYAAGTSIDWSYAVTNIPYSYMIELRGKTHRFLLPKEEIITTCVEVLNGVYRLMDFVDRRCKGTDTCPCPKWKIRNIETSSRHRQLNQILQT